MAESTKNKILHIIKELNYQPNFLASTLASKKPALFATLFPAPPSPDGYWTKPAIGVTKRINELKQYGVRIQPFTFNQADHQSFADAAQSVLEIKPDGVVFPPFFKNESTSFIHRLKELNIPFIFIDSEIKNAGQLGYVGQDSYQSGMVSAKLLDQILPDGNVLVIHFAKEMDNQNHLVQREKGFYDWFKKQQNTQHRIFTQEVPDTSTEKWMDGVIQNMRKKNIKGVFVTNSKVYYVGRLMEKYQLAGLKVIGHDLIRENIACLKKDVVQFLICQRPEEQGYHAINKLFRHVVQKRSTASENYAPIDIVIKENVDFYKELKKEI